MRWLFILSSLLILTGCLHNPPEIEYIDNYVLLDVECEDFGKVESVRALPVVFVKARTDDGYIVLGLRGDQYSNLAIVMRDTLRYIEDQQAAIVYYKGCIERHNSIELNEEGEPQ